MQRKKKPNRRKKKHRERKIYVKRDENQLIYVNYTDVCICLCVFFRILNASLLWVARIAFFDTELVNGASKLQNSRKVNIYCITLLSFNMRSGTIRHTGWGKQFASNCHFTLPKRLLRCLCTVDEWMRQTHPRYIQTTKCVPHHNVIGSWQSHASGEPTGERERNKKKYWIRNEKQASARMHFQRRQWIWCTRNDIEKCKR